MKGWELIFAAGFASLCDATTTLLALQVGAIEANPFMDSLIKTSEGLFLTFKFFWPILLLGILSHLAEKAAQRLSVLSVILYLGLASYTSYNLLLYI